MKKLIFTTALLTSFAASNAWSACADVGPQDEIVAGDNCTSVITLAIDTLVRVQGLEDIDLGTYDSGSSLSGSDPDGFCIGTNGSAGVDITFSSPTSFNLTGTAGNTDTIPYQLSFSDGITNSSDVANVTSGNPNTIAAADVESLDCATSPANITVSVAVSDTAVSADTYTDTITVTVAPN